MEVAVRARHLSRHHPPYVRPPPGRSLDQVTAKAALETRARPQRCTGTVRLPPNLDERRPRRLEYVALAYGASQARAERREGATFEPARGPPSAPPRRSRPSRVASRRSGSRAVARPQRIPARRRPARPVRRGRDLGCDRGDCRRVRGRTIGALEVLDRCARAACASTAVSPLLRQPDSGGRNSRRFVSWPGRRGAPNSYVAWHSWS